MSEKYDIDLLNRLYNMAKNGENESFGDFEKDVILPLKGTDKDSLPEKEKKKYIKTGEKIFKKGEFAVITMAGGQGTRLGHDGPKGTYDIGLPSHISLFEIQALKIKEASEQYGCVIPWYIMTSEENNDRSVSFFEEHGYFGLKREDVFFFTQCMLPMVHHNGEIVYDRPGHVKEGADGHGGIFKAVVKSGALKDMKKRNIKWVYVGGIDNVLAYLCDPLFVGYTQSKNCLIGSKTLIKRDPGEKVGVFCTVNGHPHVIEYTELPEKEAAMTDESGELLFSDAHILCNLFNIDIFEKMADERSGIPYHVADKKVVCEDENGEKTECKAYKFELFMFDAFRFFNDIALLRIKREDEFAPVKNKEGEDSPESARKMYLDWENRRHR